MQNIARYGNRLLDSLAPQDEFVLRSALQDVKLEYNKILYEAGRPIEFAYFPRTGVISMLKHLADGRAAEVGTVGREGMAGAPLIFGSDSGPDTVHVQVQGEGWRLPARHLRDLLARSPGLQASMHRYAFALFGQATQLVACTHFHEVEQRTARWLLMVEDRMPDNDFPLTHDVLSLMLGVRRSSVTVAAGHLSDDGLIEYRRGRVLVLDRAGLERRACECYRAIRREYERLLGGWP